MHHRCFCCDADRAHADRVGRPVAKEARELQWERSRLKQRYQTMPDNLCTTFPRSTLAPPRFCSFLVPRSRPRPCSSSHTLTLHRFSRPYSVRVSILANLLSILAALWSPYCLTLADPPLLPRPRCAILAAPPLLSHTRCPILAALHSLHHLAPTCHLHTRHTVGSDQRPLQVLLCNANMI